MVPLGLGTSTRKGFTDIVTTSNLSARISLKLHIVREFLSRVIDFHSRFIFLHRIEIRKYECLRSRLL